MQGKEHAPAATTTRCNEHHAKHCGRVSYRRQPGIHCFWAAMQFLIRPVPVQPGAGSGLRLRHLLQASHRQHRRRRIYCGI